MVSVREGFGGESVIDTLGLSFQESIREHFEVALSDAQRRE